VDAAGHPWTEDLQAVGVDGLLLALEDQRSEPLDVGGFPDQAMGRLAQQDLARPSRLLQMGDDVHHLAGELAGSVRPGHHLPTLHSHPDGQADGRVMFELLVKSRHPIAQLDRRPHRPQRVVLVAVEDGDDRVPLDLLDRSAVVGAGRAGGVVVAGQHLPQQLGIVTFAQARGPLDVAADDGDEAPEGRVDRRLQGCPAGPAESRARGVPLTTLRTCDSKHHVRV
jgi:hypothetical protein